MNFEDDPFFYLLPLRLQKLIREGVVKYWTLKEFKNRKKMANWTKEQYEGALSRQNKRVQQSKPTTENKKVRNATKTVVNGIKFDSRLEAHFYELLIANKIVFNRQVEYVLQPGFKWHGKSIRPIKSYLDFVLPHHNAIVDCKGYANDVSPLKFKMLKYRLNFEELNPPQIYIPKNKKECECLINNLIYGK